MTLKKASTIVTANHPYLQGRNAAYLWSFIGINLAIFLSLFVTNCFTVLSVQYFWGRMTAKDGILVAIIPILTIILRGVIGDRGKARLVFWRWHYPLPGSRVFTELMSTDVRIDAQALEKKLGVLPTDPETQNKLWYRLYKEYHSEMISASHRMYLLTRDMTTIAALFVALLPAAVFIVSMNWRIAALYALCLVMQYLLIARTSCNYGTRFVLNVLTEVSQST